MYIMLCTEEYNDKIILAIIIIMVTILSWFLQTSKEETTKSVRKREGKERGFCGFYRTVYREGQREKLPKPCMVPQCRNNTVSLGFDLGVTISNLLFMDTGMFIQSVGYRLFFHISIILIYSQKHIIWGEATKVMGT